MSEIYTLYTRSNFDGLVCAALLKEIGIIDEVKFVHPKDVQDGKVQLGPNDITARTESKVYGTPPLLRN